MARQRFTAPNGDMVEIDLPDPPVKRPISEASKRKGQVIRQYKVDYFATHRRAPGAADLQAAIRAERKKR